MCIAALSIGSSTAQIVTANNITVSDIEISHTNNRTYVDMTFDLSESHIASNHSLRVTPIISNGTQMIQLPAVVIDGRRRNIVHQRGEISPEESSDILRIARSKGSTTRPM